jgi:hypothetical protein
MYLKHSVSTWSSLAAAVLFAGVISLPSSTVAQRAVPRSGSDQPAAGGRTQGGDHGGGRIRSGGGKTASGDGTSSGGNQSSGGDRSSGGSSDGAVRRAPASGDTSAGKDGNTRTAVRRDRGGAGDGGATTATTGDKATVVPTSGRQRGSNPPTGYAVERKGRPPVIDDGDTTVWVPGGYYGGYYPWGYGSFGLGGYYGGYYDPWYYGPAPYYSGYDDDYDGRLRLKVKPRSAEVLVDGYYSGLVDEFDGVFQRLRLEPGPHRIEIREDGYETLAFDVRITPDDTVTYTGQLRKIQ